MALPFLPGSTFNQKLGVARFHKSHLMDTINGLPMETGMHRPGIGGERRLFQWKNPTKSFLPRGEPSFSCNMELSKKVLSFDAFFQETVTELREGTSRKRKVKIYFYLEDDSMMIVEARMKNSSLNQGVLVKRQKIPKPQPSSKEFYTVEDFNLGAEVEVFGKAYKLCNCDQFTKGFYKKLGVILNPPLPLPIVFKEKELFGERNGRKPRSENTDHLNSMQFFQRDPLVLRFFCYWDDRATLFGDLHQLLLHYFLSDDTIELVEVLPPNSGRDNVPCFLRRSKVPKELAPMRRIGESSNHSILNVLSNGEWDYRYLLDPNETGRVVDNNYTDCDLRIGTSLNIFNKKVTIYDMDEFTKQFYRSKYGITDFTPAECPLPTKEKEKKKTKREEWSGCGDKDKKEVLPPKTPECVPKVKFLAKVKSYEDKFCHLPPYNGFGGEEDSIENCMSLHPEHSNTKDLIKFLTHDRMGLDSNILRFRINLISEVETDKERIFILSFYRTDDSFDIFEQKITGFVGGVFSSRKKVAKPCQERFSHKLSVFYGNDDLYLGNTIVINGHHFLIIAADEYALNYMEERPKEFPQSNWRLTMRKVMHIPAHIDVKKEAEAHREEEDMAYDTFKELLYHLGSKARGNTDKCCLTEHDCITLARHYRVVRVAKYEVETVIDRVRVELRRFNFEDFDMLSYQSMHHDKDNTGYLCKNTLLKVFKAHRMPVKMALLEEIINQMSEEDGRVRYCKIIDAINWKLQEPVVVDKCHQEVRCDDLHVNFKKFYEELVDLVYH